MSHLRLVKSEYDSELPPIEPQPRYQLGKWLALTYMLFCITWLVGTFLIILGWMVGHA